MNIPQKHGIHQLADEDKPREKLLNKGVELLSSAELLAILLRSGTAQESAIDLAQRIYTESNNNLSTLAKWTLEDFKAFKGVGPAKFTTLKAALELGHRRQLQEVQTRASYRCSSDIYSLFHPILCDAAEDEFWILLLNPACKSIKHCRVSHGGIDGTYADVRSILREALIARATQIALIHNHPSGNTQHSLSDKQLTHKIKEAAQLMNITVVDHIIVTDGAYYSFADHGTL